MSVTAEQILAAAQQDCHRPLGIPKLDYWHVKYPRPALPDEPHYYRFFFNLGFMSYQCKFVELGSRNGAASFHFVEPPDHRNDAFAIDIKPHAEMYRIPHPRLHHFVADTCDPEIVDLFKDNSVDFLFIDSKHYVQQVHCEIVTWTPKMKSGGWVFFDDIATDRYPDLQKFWRGLEGRLNLFELHPGYGFGAIQVTKKGEK